LNILDDKPDLADLDFKVLYRYLHLKNGSILSTIFSLLLNAIVNNKCPHHLGFILNNFPHLQLKGSNLNRDEREL